MQSMLEELHCGNVGDDTGYYGQDSSSVKAARKKRGNLKKLMVVHKDIGKELFEQYCGAQGDIKGITRYDTFTKTLKFGIRLMINIFMGNSVSADERSVRKQ